MFSRWTDHNNDGDLFAYGEAIAGLLPEINQKLKGADSPKRFRNLFAITLGTGLGGDLVRDGELFMGDNASALVDGLVVIGGGIAKAYPLFVQPLIAEMQSQFETYDGRAMNRIVQRVFNLECPEQTKTFLVGATKAITVPDSEKQLFYDPMKRTGIGISRLGTSRAVSVGAHAFALQAIDNDGSLPKSIDLCRAVQ